MANTRQSDIGTDLGSRLDRTIGRSQGHLLDIQYPDGYWWGELESNPTMEAEYLLLTHFLGVADPDRWRKLANYIRGRQSADGTWGQYYGAPGDLSTTTECYFALKLAGVSPQEPSMRQAREFILSEGGVPQTRVFTKIWLSLLDQYDWKGVPVLPPELMLLPTWFPVNIYEFASWARATIVPILILLNRKPVCAVPDSARIDELYPSPRDRSSSSLNRPKKNVSWEALFYVGDRILRQVEKLPWVPGRSFALKRAEKWVLDHQEADGGWGGIQPPWVYSLMALSTLGYPTDHPVIAKGLEGLEGFAIEEDDTLRIQACISPLWDTCLAMISLLDSDLPPDHPGVVKAGEWLVEKQILGGGDWQVKSPETPPGGWAFEFHNDAFPDLDDTAEILMALDKVRLPDEERKRTAIERGVQWILGMQSDNGGWGSFDKDNTLALLARIPFANFGEAIDPPSVDVTAHILEMMGQLGYNDDHPVVAEALEYVLSEQEEDGPWFGRWGVNYLYGCGAVLPAFEALGLDMESDRVRNMVGWLLGRQNEDGGWGESCASYVDPAYRGKGPSTASQTAWALLALLAAKKGDHPATLKGVEYLLRSQLIDGSWDEPYYTGTGFPGYGVGQRLDGYLSPEDHGYQGAALPAGFMINYHMYRIYWPLTALGRYRRFVEERNDRSKPRGGERREFTYR